MRIWTAGTLALVLALVTTLTVGCGNDAENDDGADVISATDVSNPQDVAALQDTQADTGGNTADAVADDIADDAAADISEDVPQEPMPFRVGVARGLFNAPLGMGVAGTGPAPLPGHASPFQAIYPATNQIFTPISVEAVALEGGMKRMVFIRLETIAAVKEIRREIAIELAQRGSPIAEDDILIGATHTHAAPARIISKFLWQFLADFYWTQHHDRVVAGIADVVDEAMADLEPARFGYGMAYTDVAHNDRRPENPPLLDGTMPLLRFERADGTPKAAIVIYAIHGTVVGTSNYAYSNDAGGAIEYKLEERFDHPVPVLFFNSWAGDVSPGDPRETRVVAGEPPEIDNDTDRLEAIGNTVADAAMEVWGDIETTDDVDIDHLSAVIEMSQEALGYTQEDFPYHYGALYCGNGMDGAEYGTDDPLPDPAALIASCGNPGNAEDGITSTVISAFRIGDLLIPTFPGEPVTQVGLNVVEGIAETTGWPRSRIAFIGYAQDYIGYSETEEYWWYGGYETSGALWGPKQGDYLTAESLALVAHFVDPTVPLAVHESTFELLPPDTSNAYVTAIWETENSIEVATISEQPTAELVPGDTASVTWTGGDPWIDHPTVIVEKQDETSGEWSPFLRHNGTPLANDAYEFHTGLETDPSYNRTTAHTDRTFFWWAKLPTARVQPTTTDPIVGTFRFHITGAYGDDGVDKTYEVSSDPFTVTPAE